MKSIRIVFVLDGPPECESLTKKQKIEVDVLNHFLTPKMKIAGEKKKREIIEKYGERNLAKILLSDPAVRALNANVGDIIEIERKGPSGPYIYYRIVVEE